MGVMRMKPTLALHVLLELPLLHILRAAFRLHNAAMNSQLAHVIKSTNMPEGIRNHSILGLLSDFSPITTDYNWSYSPLLICFSEFIFI